ncbi:hypothetical protein NDU88_005146 [Pleurodeles waltl]|uniref:Uncharacterized protein n=1 Tax=Pleurodeles waltl TaxID=8319 RepID=A0AAV7LBQ2_PLEWA|nr:hypothetical protein NDU88_005146 [Pleurodeles waltl]
MQSPSRFPLRSPPGGPSLRLHPAQLLWSGCLPLHYMRPRSNGVPRAQGSPSVSGFQSLVSGVLAEQWEKAGMRAQHLDSRLLPDPASGGLLEPSSMYGPRASSTGIVQWLGEDSQLWPGL